MQLPSEKPDLCAIRHETEDIMRRHYLSSKGLTYSNVIDWINEYLECKTNLVNENKRLFGRNQFEDPVEKFMTNISFLISTKKKTKSERNKEV